MTADARYVLNGPPVVAELIEGEVIAVNLESGSYYSLRGASAKVWSLLLEGHSIIEILQGFTSVGSGIDPAEAIEDFVASLLAEGLILSRHGNGPTPSRGIDTGPWRSEVLCFEHFSDMKEMLQLDPIHEVDGEVGWPKPAR
jgi:hypothetical protein